METVTGCLREKKKRISRDGRMAFNLIRKRNERVGRMVFNLIRILGCYEISRTLTIIYIGLGEMLVG